MFNKIYFYIFKDTVLDKLSPITINLVYFLKSTSLQDSNSLQRILDIHIPNNITTQVCIKRKISIKKYVFLQTSHYSFKGDIQIMPDPSYNSYDTNLIALAKPVENPTSN